MGARAVAKTPCCRSRCSHTSPSHLAQAMQKQHPPSKRQCRSRNKTRKTNRNQGVCRDTAKPDQEFEGLPFVGETSTLKHKEAAWVKFRFLDSFGGWGPAAHRPGYSRLFLFSYKGFLPGR